MGVIGRTVSPANHRWIAVLVRFGYATKGVVYGIIGLLALLAATGSRGGQTTDGAGAVRVLGEQPFGKLMLGTAAVGLLGYAIWCVLEAGLDIDQDGNGPYGLAKRIGYAINGIAHGALAVLAGQLVLGQPTEDGLAKTWLFSLLSHGVGAIVVVVVGVTILVVGGAQLVLGGTGDVMKQLDTAGTSKGTRWWIERLGRAGLMAHGVVLGLVGYSMVRAGWNARVGEAHGFGEALANLATQPYGAWLLGIVALGLGQYGAYLLACARYRDLGDRAT